MTSIDWKALLDARDADGLASAVAGRFGVTIDGDLFLIACEQWISHWRATSVDRKAIGECGVEFGDPPWSQDSWEIWIRNRLAELFAFRPGKQLADHRPTVELHTGMPGLHSTPEQLARLAIPDNYPSSSVARSKVSATNRVIRPVDGVAARVVPEDKGANQ